MKLLVGDQQKCPLAAIGFVVVRSSGRIRGRGGSSRFHLCLLKPLWTERNLIKSYEEVMEILEAFDFTRSFRAAGELAGCSHHTVEHYVALRDAGLLADGGRVERPRLIDPFLPKIEEWVDRSNDKIRADVTTEKLLAVGFSGSARTVRGGVAGVKANYRAERRRVYRPWIAEPGIWAQWDSGGTAHVLRAFRHICGARGWLGHGPGW